MLYYFSDRFLSSLSDIVFLKQVFDIKHKYDLLQNVVETEIVLYLYQLYIHLMLIFTFSVGK